MLLRAAHISGDNKLGQLFLMLLLYSFLSIKQAATLFSLSGHRGSGPPRAQAANSDLHWARESSGEMVREDVKRRGGGEGSGLQVEEREKERELAVENAGPPHNFGSCRLWIY